MYVDTIKRRLFFIATLFESKNRLPGTYVWREKKHQT